MPRERLERIELVPFRAAIAAGVASIMTAHLLVPALDDEWIGTLSAPILTDLLRGELGFEGMIVTDALEMRGVADLLPEPQAAVESVRAGADALLTARSIDLNEETHRALHAGRAVRAHSRASGSRPPCGACSRPRRTTLPRCQPSIPTGRSARSAARAHKQPRARAGAAHDHRRS